MKRALILVLLMTATVIVACSKSESVVPSNGPAAVVTKAPTEVPTLPPVTIAPSPKPTLDPCTLMPHGPGCPTPIPIRTKPPVTRPPAPTATKIAPSAGCKPTGDIGPGGAIWKGACTTSPDCKVIGDRLYEGDCR